MDTHRLPPGSVVLEGYTQSWFSKLTGARMGQPWTHCFMILDENTGVEATFSKGVTTFDLKARFRKLEEGRAFVILDLPKLSPRNDYTDKLRGRLVFNTIHQLVGRKYDPIQWLLFGLFRIFLYDGPRRVVCSRLITAAYETIEENIFDHEHRATVGSRNRFKGFCTPGDLLGSSLRVILSSPGHPSVAVNPMPPEVLPNPYR